MLLLSTVSADDDTVVKLRCDESNQLNPIKSHLEQYKYLVSGLRTRQNSVLLLSEHNDDSNWDADGNLVHQLMV